MSDMNYEQCPKGLNNLHPILNPIFKEKLIYAGGKKVIDRLVNLLGLNSADELSSIIEVSSGTVSTWRIRDTTPFELVIKVHLFTGIPIQKILFGVDMPVGIGLASCPDVITQPKDLVKDELALIYNYLNGKCSEGANIFQYEVNNYLSLNQVYDLIVLIKEDKLISSLNVFLANMEEGQLATDAITLLHGKLHIKFIRKNLVQ
ncbi:helix-turn-helix domain-containing protein (plasmid) [Shewanella sp. HL-SH4]|uniref:helix-turn-helix domain-containing protein n=1 Tax=Shewanella TaxID=22 RepID=UPI003D7A25D6